MLCCAVVDPTYFDNVVCDRVITTYIAKLEKFFFRRNYIVRSGEVTINLSE